MLNTCLLQ